MRRLSAVAGPGILFLIVTAFFWKLLTKQFTWMDQPDMAYQVLPWYQFQAVSWHRGEFPLWDPHVWAGQPLLGQLQPGAAYPPNWLLFLMPLKDGRINPLWMNLDFVLTHFLAALFCYWLCRYLGRSRPASVLGGAAFALTGVVGSVGWPQMLSGAIWIPLVFLYFLRSVRRELSLANAVFCGTFLGVSFLSGHHQIPTLTGLMVAALWIFEIRRRLRAVKPAVICLLFALLVSALQTLPALEYGIRSIRWVGSHNAVFWGQAVPYAVHQQPAHSLFPLEILGFVLPNLSQHDTFVGLAVVTLGLSGLAGWFKTAEVRILGTIAVGGLLFALGGFSIFHGLSYMLIPMVEKARSPAMAVVIVQFAMAVLAAYGLDRLRGGAIGHRSVAALLVAGVLSLGAVAIAASFRAETSLEYERLAVAGLVALALAALLQGWKSQYISDAAAVGLLFVVVLFELGTVLGANYRHRETPGGFLAELQKNTDIVAFLREQPGPIRLEVDTEAVPYNIGDWEELDQFRAYLGGMTWNVAQLEIDRLNGGRLAPVLFALNYYLGSKPARAEQEEIFRGKSGLKIYRNPDVFPRFWTAHEAVGAKRPDLIAGLRTADLRQQVLLADAAAVPALDKCAATDEVKVLERRNSRLLLNVHMACKGMVIASETFFPGWVATSDGRPTPVYEADGALRGLVVDAGTHRVEFHYRPLTAYLGALLTALGVTGALLLALVKVPAQM
jgi:hypothetical protein